MVDSNRSNKKEKVPHIQFGMSSFSQNAREQFGQNLRLAMACIAGSPTQSSGIPKEGIPIKGMPTEAIQEPIQRAPLPIGGSPTPTHAIPKDEPSIRHRLKALTQEITSQHADLLELLVRFDDLKGWQQSGAKHCAAWMNFELGISTKLSWEYLRVGRRLNQLPTLRALFRAGKLSWSKVRLISRVADEENEKTLCHAALDAPVSDVKRLCEAYRWKTDDNREAENERAMRQWDSRSFTWDETSIGSTRIQLVLPPEIAQAFLNSVEHSLNQLESADHSMSQRRADAAVLMAERSLQNAGGDIAAADRYQVIVSVDSTEMKHGENTTTTTQSDIPTKRPTLIGAGSIATETARRIACDCSVTLNKSVNGEPVDIGRKSRIWPNAMERAIKARDQHCIWPGCTQSRHLHIHHIEHWADGGATSINNGACLCSHHHTMVHEGGYNVQHVLNNETRLDEQFTQQQRTNDLSMFEFESNLRNDKASFNKVRKLSPTRYRFRIVDAHGQDILNQKSGNTKASLNSSELEYSRQQSTRIDCSEPKPAIYYAQREHRNIGMH